MPPRRKMSIGVRLPPQLLSWLREQAESREVNLSEVIRGILTEAKLQGEARTTLRAKRAPAPTCT